MRQLTQKKTTQILNWKAIVKVQVERNWKSCKVPYGILQLFLWRRKDIRRNCSGCRQKYGISREQMLQ